MKSKEINRKADNYAGIKRKLYSYVLVAAIAAIMFVVIFRQILRGIAGEWIVDFLINSFHFGRRDAMTIYQNVIRNNMEIVMYVVAALCFLLLSRIILSSFMRYFDEINTGIDALIQSKDSQAVSERTEDVRSARIELSAEMAFIEQKLNTLKQTLEKREQDAKLAEQRKNDLVMYLAHDIKTPLTSVIGYLSLLDEAADMPVEQKAKYVHITLDKAYRLEQLIDEFFEITRYNLQAIKLSKENIDIYYMLAQMADEFYPLLTTTGKQIALHVPEDLAIYGDADKLARVFNNVLKNAVAYSPDNSIIDITAAISGNMMSIVFANAGSIPKDKLTSIFDKFYRLDSARSSDTGGAGLGLAIAKETVLSHGGRIYADSENGSTTFTVELPTSGVKEI